MMSSPDMIGKVYGVILKRMVETGQAPHYTEIAAELGVPVEEGRKALHDLIDAKIPAMWLYPETDYICSFAPFNNLPTQYRISVDGVQKWFGQWGFESLAVCWLYPGKVVRIDAPCLDCGAPLRVEIKDGVVLKEDPKGIMGYVAIPFSTWFQRFPYAWSTMNLFRSEEHIRNWSKFDPAAEQGIVPLANVVKLFSMDMFKKRLDPDYVARVGQYAEEFFAAVAELGKTRPFWRLW
jgi:hypothetical protein